MDLNKIKLFTFLFISHNASIIADYKKKETVSENEFVSMYGFVENKTITLDETKKIAI